LLLKQPNTTITNLKQPKFIGKTTKTKQKQLKPSKSQKIRAKRGEGAGIKQYFLIAG